MGSKRWMDCGRRKGVDPERRVVYLVSGFISLLGLVEYLSA